MAALIRRLASGQGLAPASLLLGLLLVILVLMGRATTDSAQFGRTYFWLLLVGSALLPRRRPGKKAKRPPTGRKSCRSGLLNSYHLLI